MRLFFIQFAFFVAPAFGQKTLDFRPIIADHSFCLDEKATDSNSICNSKNLLEIWLSIISIDTVHFIIDHSAIKLQFDGCNWKGVRNTYKLKELESDPSRAIDEVASKIALKAINGFDSLFAILKNNNIFILPDQRSLIQDSVLDDRILYTIIFKVGDKFRSYSFFDLESNKSNYGKLPEFENYKNITKAFLNFMIPE
jgi:hypothetical protein